NIHLSKCLTLLSKCITGQQNPVAKGAFTAHTFKSNRRLVAMGNCTRANVTLFILFPHVSRSAMNCTECLWPKSTDGTVIVPYNFSSNYSADQLALFKSTMQEYESLTCVRFVPRANETDFLSIVSDNGCASFLGKVGGDQTVQLDSYGCIYRGIIQHELNHALGFYHEQSRSDRDDYVTIHTENIIPGNFNKADSNNLGLEYDYSSVMHYSGDAFSKNGNLTIVPKPDPTVPIGQRDGLSILDVSKINRLYQCGKSPMIRTSLLLF
uniref:Metalloendopeptidase n=1 Tax=Xenopus tropicalis TaxID=8364 RepID=A0A803JRW0_XENTR